MPSALPCGHHQGVVIGVGGASEGRFSRRQISLRPQLGTRLTVIYHAPAHPQFQAQL